MVNDPMQLCNRYSLPVTDSILQACAYIWTHVYIHMCVPARMHVRMYVYMYGVYVCTV